MSEIGCRWPGSFLARDVLAVGAPFADGPGGSLGAVHVFTRGPSGWSRSARLTAADGANGDELGIVVALASEGGTLVAGARRADVGGKIDAGAAYVFTQAGGAWSQSAKLTAPAPAAGDLFGVAVAVAGPRIVVGARFRDDGATDAGAVYVFDSVSAPPTVLLASPPQAGASFGQAVAASGDSLVVGAVLADVPANGGVAIDAGSILACPAPIGQGAASFTIAKTDGRTTYQPGQELTYTVTVTNTGTAAGAAHVTDVMPPQLTNTAWCRGPGCTPNHAGNLDDTVTLAPQESAVYTVTGRVSQNAQGAISNTACVVEPDGTTRCSDPDVDQPGRQPICTGDFTVTKTDGVAEVSPGQALTYVMTLRNLESCTVTRAAVTDSVPAALTAVHWTCTASPGGSCAPRGVGSIADAVTLPAGGTATYRMTAVVGPNASGSVTNKVCVALPAGLAPAQVCATDTDTVSSQSDLQVTKTDGLANVSPGQTTTYTITVKNLGPDAVTGASVTDTVPAGLTAVHWSCSSSPGSSCSPSGVGSIADHVTLPAGGTASYTLTATVGPNASGTITNQACAAAPAGTVDPVPGNNCGTDTDIVVGPVPPQPDLKITKTDGLANAVPGQTLAYTITVTNTGNVPVAGARVSDSFPAALEQVKWCCGAGCTPLNAGLFTDVPLNNSIPPGGNAVCQVTGIVAPAFTGNLVNTASVALPAPLADVNPADNVATAETMVMPGPGVTGFCDGIDGPFVEGGILTYTFVLRNGGPFAQADNPGDEFTDVLPPTLTLLSASADSGVATSGANTAHWNGAIPVKGEVTIKVVAMINAGTAGMTICNQGTFFFDADGNGTNESSGLTDDPALPGAADPCCFKVLLPPQIPTLAPAALALLALLLTAAALRSLRRRRTLS